MDREAVLRLILEAPMTVSHRTLGDQVGLSESTARRIRYGLAWADFMPELPRHRIADRMASCRSCRLFDDKSFRCSLRLPEAFGVDDEPRLSTAQGCNCYFER